MVNMLTGFFSSFIAAIVKAIANVAPIRIINSFCVAAAVDADVGFGVGSAGRGVGSAVGSGVGFSVGVGVGLGVGLGVGVTSGTVSSADVKPIVGSCSSVQSPKYG